MAFIIGPAEYTTAYKGQVFQRDETDEPFTIGEPVFEEAGVEGRRAYVAHPFSPAAIAYARVVIAALGHDGVVSVVDRLPSDWRYPRDVLDV